MKTTLAFTCLLALSPLAGAATVDEAAAQSKNDPAYVWDLSLVYKDEAAFQAAKAALAAEIPKLLRFQGHLGDSAATLQEAMDTVYGMRKQLARLSSYASQKLDENLKDAGALERNQEVDLLATDFSQAASFIDPELLADGRAKIEGYVNATPGLAPYRFPIAEIFRKAPHTLGTQAEHVLSATSLITGTPESVYSILTSADMPWPTVKLSDGREVVVDQAGYTKYRALPNRADREAVFRAFFGTFKHYERTLGVSLYSQVKTDWFKASARNYPSSLAAALADNDVPESVYRMLIEQTNANLPTLYRYYRLRGRLLGIKDLRYWDIYPPIVKLDKVFPYSTAKRLVIDATRPLGTDYTRLITSSLDGRYTHVYPSPGKRSGAYMNGAIYDVHPFVLTNYNDDYESVSTLAHEWGHGCHSLLANTHQPYPTADYSIFVAEIASTCNEALLLDHMLKVARTDDERLYYLGNALENLRATFFRQAMFAEFELRIHEVVEHGGALSGARLSQIYGDLLRKYQGDAQGVMKIDDFVTDEWAYIPHFYMDFYVYQYATSIAASQAFADRIMKGEPGARETYLAMLEAGGSDHPYELVKRAGVDLATPAPYQALAARMNSIMDQIQAILDKRGE